MSSVDWLNVQGITILAEIFMVRLEAAARASREKAGQSNSRFVPFADSSQFIFRDGREQMVETAPEKVPARHT
jgi:hypothetical protein